MWWPSGPVGVGRVGGCEVEVVGRWAGKHAQGYREQTVPTSSWKTRSKDKSGFREQSKRKALLQHCGRRD